MLDYEPSIPIEEGIEKFTQWYQSANYWDISTKKKGYNLINDFLERIREVAGRKIIYTEHALNKMNIEEEMITKDEVRQVIFEGEIIEDYPEDTRGHSCLIFTFSDKDRPIHVVCAPKEEYLGIITAYVPNEEKWKRDYKTRK